MDYFKLYSSFMSSRKSMSRLKRKDIYYEKHHILPSCLGGSNSKDNLVLLTAKEHFLAHRILYKMYPNDKNIVLSFWGMCNQKNSRILRYIPSSRSYEEARLAFLENNTGDKNPKGFLEKTHTPETKHLQSISNKGKVYSEETKDKIRLTKIGRKYSNEVNLKKGKKDELHNRARRVMHVKTNVKFSTIKSAAHHYNISTTSIYNWIKKKKIVYT